MSDAVSRAVEIAEIVGVLLDGGMARYANPEEVHDPEKLKEATIQIKKNVRDFWISTNPENESMMILSIRFDFGIRLVLNGEQHAADGEPSDQEFGRIEASFVGQYLLEGSQPSEEAIMEYCKTIGMLNIWPYWREHAHDMARRMGWDGVVVPLFKLRFREAEQKMVSGTPSRRKNRQTVVSPPPAEEGSGRRIKKNP